ncbi:MAG: sulfatase [Phycisphaeraceae bacterium]
MPDRPNVIVITTHDSGRWFGCYGHETLHTPNVDRLAREGVRLTNHFCASPICSASRAAMMTGCYPQRNGVLDLVFPPFDCALHDPTWHLSYAMRAAGYRTRLFYFQHEAHNPDDLAFDERRVERVTDEGGQTVRPACTDVAADVADFLETEGASHGPFYAQVGFFETHIPYNFGGAQPDDEHGVRVPDYLEDNGAARENCGWLQGALRKVDEAVGTILDALERTGLAENTIVVFCTDHGVELPRAKWFVYDAGIEAAMIWRWPAGGITGGRACEWLTSNVDFMPTLLELTGATARHEMDGVSYAAALRGEANAQPGRDAIFAYFQKGESRCVRTERYKLIRYFLAGGGRSLMRHAGESAGQPCMDVRDPRMRRVVPAVQLFDLQADPLEVENLAEREDHAELRAELEGRMWRWMESVGDPVLEGPTRTPFFENSHAAYRQWKAEQAQEQRA